MARNFSCKLITAILPALLLPVLKSQNLSNLASNLLGNPTNYLSVCQDSTGFMWFYTQEGMVRFDGSVVKRYPLPQDLYRGMEQYSTLICDSGGDVALATNEGNVFTYDLASDRFLLEKDLSDSHNGLSVFCMLPLPDGERMFGTSGGMFEGDWQINPSALSGKRVLAMTPCGTDRWYAASDDGIYLLERFSPRNWAVDKIASPPEGTVEKLFYCQGILYVGTFSGCYRLKDGRIVRVQSIPSISVTCFAPLSSGSIMVGTDGGGLYCYNPSSGEVEYTVTHSEDTRESLTSNSVLDLCTDKDGRLWIVSRGGVSHIDFGESAYREIRHIPGSRNSLASNDVRSLFLDADSNLWAGSSQGVTCIDLKNNNYRHFLTEGEGNFSVLAIDADRYGRIWAGGFGMNVYCIDPGKGSVRGLPVDGSARGEGVSSKYIFCLKVLGDNLYMGGIEGPLTRYDMSSKTYRYYDVHDVKSIVPLSEKALLLATDHDVELLDIETGDVDRKSVIGGVKISSRVQSAVKDRGGRIWLATDGDGLILYNPKTLRARQYGKADGVATQAFNLVCEDSSGNIWFAGDDHLYYFERATRRIIHPKEYLEMGDGFYNSNCSASLPGGELAIGTTDGIQVINTETGEMSWTDSRLYLSSFELVKNSGVPEPDSLGNVDLCRKVTLLHGQNEFSIGFSSINYDFPRRVRYKYSLEGYDSAEQVSDAPGKVLYQRVRPGKYRFHIDAVDKATLKKIGEKDLEILIKPPLALSWWAEILYAALLGAAVIFVYNYSQKRKNISSQKRSHTIFEGRELPHESAAPSDTGQDTDKAFLNKLSSYVNGRLSDPSLTVDDIAKEMGMSRTSFFSKLKSVSGENPSSYVRDFRLNRAMELLKEHRYQIAEVAEMTGFSDSRYFSTCFKKRFGISPSKV